MNILTFHSYLFKIENIYIITGLSSCDWVDQTKDRMPEMIQKRVFHRDNIPNKFVDDLKPGILDVAPGLGELLTSMIIKEAGSGENVETKDLLIEIE